MNNHYPQQWEYKPKGKIPSDVKALGLEYGDTVKFDGKVFTFIKKKTTNPSNTTEE